MPNVLQNAGGSKQLVFVLCPFQKEKKNKIENQQKQDVFTKKLRTNMGVCGARVCVCVSSVHRGRE